MKTSLPTFNYNFPRNLHYPLDKYKTFYLREI